jgi:hypothetical protein
LARLGRRFPISRVADPVSFPPVAFDSVGAGSSADVFGVVGNASTSWPHNIGSNANTLLVFSHYVSNSIALVATVGGTNYNALASNYVYNGGNAFVYGASIFLVRNPPKSAQTIIISNTTGGGTQYIAGNSIAYSGVGSFDIGFPLNTAPQTNAGYFSQALSGDPTLTIPNTRNGQRIVNWLGYSGNQSSVGFSGYTAANTRFTYLDPGNKYLPFIIGDSPGGGPITFSAAITALAYEWWNSGIILNPATPFRQ